MSFVYGIVHCKSSKKKFNTKLSTEVNVVCVSEYLTYTTWMCLFMELQGFSTKYNIQSQDNQSAIEMENNGKKLCTRNSRRIDMVFFVKYRIDICNMLIT